MHLFNSRNRLLAILLMGGLALSWMTTSPSWGADHGRLSGTVSDPQGNPLMGATVLVTGAMLGGYDAVDSTVNRVITDAHGKFTVARLIPGWYSVRVTSPTRLPALRTGVQVEAGQTSRQDFVLTDIFAPLRFQVPRGSVSTWGDDWKWILRTSAATRPILRYQEAEKTGSSSKTRKAPLPADQRLIGMMPGSTRGQPLAGDPGLGSVLAYLRPLSEDSDLLVAGSMRANGLQASSLATAFRKNLAKGDPQELAIVVHQLSFAEGLPLASGELRESLSHAQAVVVSYAHTRRLSDSVSFTTGFEINYLNTAGDASAARPRMKLEYRMSPTTVVAVRYGTLRPEGDPTLLERVGVLNAFPRVNLRGYRPVFENSNHLEVSVSRKLNDAARVEIAAFRDYIRNAAVWGSGGAGVLEGLAGNVLPNPASDGVTLNAGNYRSSGLRAAYLHRLGNNLETAFMYAVGGALTANDLGAGYNRSLTDLSGILRAQTSQSLAGKVSARIPACKTQVITSYEWLQGRRLTSVNPYGLASLQLPAFLGLQIRQPLPTLAFIPARIEALADFRNLLAQGYVPVSQPGENSLLLTPAYRSFRGGFSLLF